MNKEGITKEGPAMLMLVLFKIVLSLTNTFYGCLLLWVYLVTLVLEMTLFQLVTDYLSNLYCFSHCDGIETLVI